MCVRIVFTHALLMVFTNALRVVFPHACENCIHTSVRVVFTNPFQALCALALEVKTC